MPSPSDPKKILCPVDFSSGSLAALECALELAARFDATVELLHAWQLPPLLEANPLTWTTGRGQSLGDSLESSARTALDELVASLPSAARARMRAHVTWSPAPTQTILDHAKTQGIDLIVMGTHGRGAFAHALLGSVAERVLRAAPCPVLVVPPAAKPQHPPRAGAM